MTGRGRSNKGSDTGASERGAHGGVQVVVTDETVEPEISFPGRSCRVCRGEDTEEMVRCDKCLKWYHFRCVGVTQEIENKPWSCLGCANPNQILGTISNPDDTLQAAGGARRKQPIVAVANVSPATLPVPVLQPKDLLTPKRSSLAKPVPSSPSKVDDKKKKTTKAKAKPTEPVSPVLAKGDVQPKEKKEKAKSATSRATNRTGQALAQLKLQRLEEERALDAKKLEQERTYMEEKFRLLEEMISEGGSSVSGVTSIVGEWVESQKIPSAPFSFVPRAHSSQKSQSKAGNQGRSHASSSSSSNTATITSGTSQDSNTNPLPIPLPESRHHSSRLPEQEDFYAITRKQLAARQAVSKELPQFSGNPEDWPLFLSTFNSTTAMCGFTNDENVFRLQKSLKGRAFEAVKSRLMHPSNVPGVLRTLKMLFGQPDAIIFSLIDQINALPAIREEKLETLVDFAVSVENFCATVDACGMEEHLYNVTLLHQLVNKLPSTIKLNWAQYRHSLPGVNLAAFSTWIYTLAEAASTVTIPSIVSRPVRTESRNTTKKGNAFLNAHTEDISPKQSSSGPPSAKKTIDECPVCKGSCKTVDKCKRFAELSRDSRWAAVREFGLCRRCLCRHNGGCTAKPCGKDGCQFKHHALLHNDQQQSPPTTSTVIRTTATTPLTSQGGINSSSHGCHTHQTKSSDTLFRYLPVVLQGKHGCIRTYAFLDDGSALTLLDEELADELELNGKTKPLCLHWTGGTQRQEAMSRVVDLEIAGAHREAKKFAVYGARTVKELLLPYQTMDIQELTRTYPHLQGLPIDSYQSIRPRVLIGIKDQHLSLVLKCCEGEMNQPIAVKTRLGWTVCGGGTSDPAESPVYSMYHICSCEGDQHKTDEDLHKAMKEYFALDSLGILNPKAVLLPDEDRRAQSLLQSLTRFTGERYETGLLWRHKDFRLPDSRAMALKRFQCLEKRMQKDEVLTRTLKQKIADHLSKGYIRKLTDKEMHQSFQRTWYLPVFPVTNPNKPGKVRMVWDAAAKSFGVSLNSALLKGPDQLSSLFTVLIRFREHPVALTGDIREMFHQVLIREEDQQCQRFFWRDENGNVAIYIMRVMTFGACCSPSCAQHVMNLNAKRFAQRYPVATDVIQRQHYVDDMLVSVDTEEEAIKLALEVKFVHSQGGFEIRNWISNSQRVLNALHEANIEEKNLDLAAEMATEKVLGMWWCTASDIFTYRIGWDRYDRDLLEGHRRPTKREVLRVLMTIFDPLGLIAQFLMFLKILLQEIWRADTQWDEEIDDSSFTKWRVWLRVLPQVERVQIPRCFRSKTSTGYVDVQLHTFVDASENGMAAACYVRFRQDEVFRCCLVAGKTKVAPLKFHSIPRLELMAAVIGTRLARTVVESLSITASKLFYHSDSRDVICWLNSDHRRYTPFVAFRVSEILEATDANQWRWVPTKLNVADDATKWEKFPDMSPGSRWYSGPEFLWQPEEAWPQHQDKRIKTNTELRSHLLTHSVKPDSVINVSSWKRMVNAAVFVHRFPINCRLKRQKKPILSGHPTTEELLVAERYVIRQAQREVYPDEVAALLKPDNDLPSSVPKTSIIYKLTPWLDDHGLMRMRGRISACTLATEAAKNPVILPRDHHTTKLIIAHFHNKYHHQNHETVINEIRQRFCVPRLRTAYSKVRKDCQRCKNERSIPRPPIMADLPAERLDAFARPFTHVGIDYFGPIEVVIGRRVEKRWGMLVTCLTTRAVHIEVVHTLSTDSCIMGLRNFVARRGTPRTIYSDRGTCFIGANRELGEAATVVNLDDLMKEFTCSETTWKFNPPASPHMGGSWERLIGVVKRNLMSLRPTRKPSDEVLRNLLTEIENTVNSRPLTHVPADDECAPALTPNHFLLGSSDGTKPLSNLNDSGMLLRQSWRTSQVLANQFWKRWLTDYLPEITRRTKWHSNTKPIAINDVVVIVDPKLPRNCWPKGKVIATSVSKKDGQIRAATVRTANGIYERPVAKLAVLDIRRDEK